MMPMMTAIAAMIEMVSARGPGRRRAVLLRGARGGRIPPLPKRPKPNSPVLSLADFFCRDEPEDVLEDSSEEESRDSSSGVVLTILLPV
ncbi:hypothetical protein HMPREF1549_01343 [Actinomyces johnsonii F0510]|uniref:Uncharacterized protein n=1 Tax=Actinomyces johnsonii F0510 TaxID=1227262 RepID=U1PVX8_9ACTO|nr:hypothetical protein HMPREF1549_01343 [Actinomyces johnsonii F0510]